VRLEKGESERICKETNLVFLVYSLNTTVSDSNQTVIQNGKLPNTKSMITTVMCSASERKFATDNDVWQENASDCQH